MSRAEQVRAAIKEIEPADHEACEKLLGMALDYIETEKKQRQREKDVASKEARKKLTTYEAALRRAAAAHKKLPAGIMENLEVFGQLVDAPAPKFDALIGVCARLLELRRHRPSPADLVQVSAAAWAADILQRQGLKPAATRDGKWVRLAAILSGDASGKQDLLHHCRQWKQAALD